MKGQRNCQKINITYLYQEVLKCQFSPALQSLREVDVSCRLTAIERILAYVKVIMAIQHKQPYLTALWQYEMYRHAASPNRFITEYTLQLYQHIVSALCHGIAQKEFHSSLDPRNAARVLLEIMHAPYVAVSLLPEQPLSGTEARKKYTLRRFVIICRESGMSHFWEIFYAFITGLRKEVDYEKAVIVVVTLTHDL